MVTRLDERIAVAIRLLVTGQLHSLVHTERLGQRLGSLGRTHVLHRVAAHQPLAAQPGIKTAPARQNKRDAAGAAPAAVHLCDPTPHVGVVHRRQHNRGLKGIGLEFLQVQGIKLYGALCQAFFNTHMLQVTLHQRVGIRHCIDGCRVHGHAACHRNPYSAAACGSRRVSAAPARSPICARNSVPMSLWKRSASGEASTSMPKASWPGPARSGTSASDMA
ncbi:hypothetical protein D9M73_76900 [compost metagenome]